jgi:hypothetical protein
MPTDVTGWLTTQGTVFCQQGILNSSRDVINASSAGRNSMWDGSTITAEPFILELNITNSKCVQFKHILSPPVILDWQ